MPTTPSAWKRCSPKAWFIYIIVSVLISLVVFLQGNDDRTPQSHWDSCFAPWLGEAAALEWNPELESFCQDLIRIQADEAQLDKMIEHLGAAEGDDRDIPFIAHPDGSLPYRNAKVYRAKELLLFLDEGRKAVLQDNGRYTQEYALIKLEEPGQAVVTCWRHQDSPDLLPGKSVEPNYPELLHKTLREKLQDSLPGPLLQLYALILPAIFVLGFNFVGNGLVWMLGGPRGGCLSLLCWYALPCVCWVLLYNCINTHEENMMLSLMLGFNMSGSIVISAIAHFILTRRGKKTEGGGTPAASVTPPASCDTNDREPDGQGKQARGSKAPSTLQSTRP